MGASLADVVNWLPRLRTYPKYDDDNNDDFGWAVYAVTHVVYALSDYNFYRLSPGWLPQEYAF